MGELMLMVGLALGAMFLSPQDRHSGLVWLGLAFTGTAIFAMGSE